MFLPHIAVSLSGRGGLLSHSSHQLRLLLILHLRHFFASCLQVASALLQPFRLPGCREVAHFEGQELYPLAPAIVGCNGSKQTVRYSTWRCSALTSWKLQPNAWAHACSGTQNRDAHIRADRRLEAAECFHRHPEIYLSWKKIRVQAADVCYANLAEPPCQWNQLASCQCCDKQDTCVWLGASRAASPLTCMPAARALEKLVADHWHRLCV